MQPLFRRGIAAAILSLAVLSCASVQLSPDEEASLRAAMDTPLTFVVPRSRSYESWDRAREFVDRYSSMKLRSATDSVLVTYEEPAYQPDPVPVEVGSSIRYGYTVRRFSVPEGIQIAVICTASSKLGEKGADQNAHIAAHYIRSGSIACVRCIVR